MKKYVFLILVIIVVILLFLTYFLKKDETIKIGFSGTLSGKYSTLGHSVLNGFLLAFDDVDYEVNDKKIKIIVKDDKQNEESAKSIINFFIKENIDLIVGNTTSAMTKISLSQILKNSKTFLFSVTSSSGEFSGKDDNFFRTQVALSKERFDILSRYLIKHNIKSLLAVYDYKNSSYSKNYLSSFQESFISSGGKSFIETISMKESFETILKKIKEKKDLDGVFIVANSVDSSRLIQFLKLNNINKKFCASGWAKNHEFLEDGGKAVNGTLFLSSYNENSVNKKYLDFIKRYKEKFKIEPTIFSAQAYETGKVILKILEKDSDLKNFKTNLLSIKKFEGLQGFLLFDKYGDIQREQYLTVVKDNEFKKIYNY
ncbi:ABC transporter substrate-binding protein [Halarcobacter anaerophilus]|uniref:ABC transporter substrate-binding protein n=1 Tax=Halarcobacter anaerophilus TaxID=877500 RepID=A0A4Q0XY88_9BACT|nr:ABC transporter substrate-binding protein [Halarcobacter anaerophilus]QDF29727.1 periplasmic ligand-binding domain-containing protein [Halarcobacter anaerophilus]RXJ62650.1 ABC transporter substrate-binding protein [Halarcobacter anaerophilus]